MNSEGFLNRSARFVLSGALAIFTFTASAQNLVILTNLVSLNGTNGQQPSGALMQAADGNLYGTAVYGGTNSASVGTIFRLTPAGNFTNLVFFNITNGANPNSGLIQDAAGNFFGTTAYGGTYANVDPSHIGFGTVFKMTTNGALTTLASFSGQNGKSPNGLVEISPDVFYGSANSGGAYSNFAGYGYGTLFMANSSGTLSNLLSFNDANGAGPSSALLVTSNGTIYGTTTAGGQYEYGTAFRLTANGAIAAQFTFTLTNGAVPGTLIQGRDGNLYGVTAFGGSSGFGTIFRLTTNFVFTTLLNFNGTNGNGPASLILGNDGNFYGVTAGGGANGYGNVFQFKTNGVLTPLYQFAADNFGVSSLMQTKDGSFYGTTSSGGSGGRGSIFKLTVIPAPNILSVTNLGHNISFTWAAVAGMTYDIQYVTNQLHTNWTKLKSVTANSSIGTVTDAMGTNAHRFYRVALIAGTPAPTIKSFKATANSISFTWTAIPNLTYDVQYVTNFTQTNWTKLRSVLATNALATTTDSIAPGTQRFYRLSVPR